ncbi:Tripeptidyl-peptidase sed1 [Cytospora mali]|uniref:Tripeptidyl-peptidase sed1 n=1 Tax=Cytospora mali TaxID=578113 RepID=A0A194VZD2_CYTMA|nr:Tripeptidyl-peptidase sed1 [Valsa mali]
MPLERDALPVRREIPATHVLHERHLSPISQRWTKKEKVSPEATLPMRIGLKQSNLQAGHDKLMELSNPDSSIYGQHMTAEEVVDFFAPQQASVDIIIDWLVSSGISRDRIGQSVNKQWIQLDASTEEAEGILFAEYYIWECDDGSHDLATDSYHVPAHVKEHIDYVTPGIRLRSGVGKRATKSIKAEFAPTYKAMAAVIDPHAVNSTSCSQYITAGCIQAQYHIPPGETAEPGNELGIFESLDQHYSKADLDGFFSTLYPYLHIPNGTYPENRLIDGAIGAYEDPYDGPWPIELGEEADLDFEAAWPLIWPQKTVLFQEDDQYYEYTGDFNGFWNTFLDAIDGSYCTYSAYGETGDCDTDECLDPVYPDPNVGGYSGELQCGVYKPTNVISISYAGLEPGLPNYYIQRQCNEWMKLALQGVTTVVSSGDYGVTGFGSTCPTNAAGQEVFIPLFLSTCPYGLSVGSTELDRYNTSGPPRPWERLHEISTTRFQSGGGFSNVFPTPEYQQAAVDAYFDKVGSSLGFEGYNQTVVYGDFSNITSGVFNRGGRGYPDVAAVGDRQVILYGGEWTTVGGTSLSAPVFASVLTLINEKRLAAGKSTVGFVNPVLYEHPEAFNDITVGSIPGCNTTGFVTATGWDPVSGLGSPIYPKLLDVLLSA